VYSSLWSEDTEALEAAQSLLSEFEQMGFQMAFESENAFAQ